MKTLAPSRKSICFAKQLPPPFGDRLLDNLDVLTELRLNCHDRRPELLQVLANLAEWAVRHCLSRRGSLRGGEL